MERNERRDALLKVNEIIYGQLTYAETKNGVMVGFLGAAIIGLFACMFEAMACWLRIYLIVICAILAAALIVSITSFFPNISTLTPDKKNNYFWGDIAKYKTASEYLGSYFEDEKQIENDIAAQNIQVSRIIARKNKLFAYSLIIALIALPGGIIAVAIYMICKKRKNK